MTTRDQVAGAATPKDAMLAIADALDVLLAREAAPTVDEWGAWAAPQQAHDAPHRVTTVSEGEDSSELNFRPPSPEKQQQRIIFEAQNLKLGDTLGAPANAEEYSDAYALGGPLWLYHGNRELVMSYPYAIRQAMVQDVEEDSPDEAREMARDVLKASGDETGPGRSPAIAEADVS